MNFISLVPFSAIGTEMPNVSMHQKHQPDETSRRGAQKQKYCTIQIEGGGVSLDVTSNDSAERINSHLVPKDDKQI